MLISAIFYKLFSNALTTRKDMAIFYSRSAILVLLSACFISYNILFVINLQKAIGLYGGLFNLTSLTQSFSIFILLLSYLILCLFLLYLSLQLIIITSYDLYIALYLKYKDRIINIFHSVIYLTFIVLFTYVSLHIYSINLANEKFYVLLGSLLSGKLLLLATLSNTKQNINFFTIVKCIIENKKASLVFFILFKLCMHNLQELVKLFIIIPPSGIQDLILVNIYIYIISLLPCLYIFYLPSQIINTLNSIHNKKIKTNFSPLAVNYNIVHLLLLTSGFVVFQIYINPVVIENYTLYSSKFTLYISTRLNELINYKSSYLVRKPNFNLLQYKQYNLSRLSYHFLFKNTLDRDWMSPIDLSMVYKSNLIYWANRIGKTTESMSFIYDNNKRSNNSMGSICSTSSLLKLPSLLKYKNLSLSFYPAQNIKILVYSMRYINTNAIQSQVNPNIHNVPYANLNNVDSLGIFTPNFFHDLIRRYKELHAPYINIYSLRSDYSFFFICDRLNLFRDEIKSLFTRAYRNNELQVHIYDISRDLLDYSIVDAHKSLSNVVEDIRSDFTKIYGLLGLLWREKNNGYLIRETHYEMCRILTLLDREWHRFNQVVNYTNHYDMLYHERSLLNSSEIIKINRFVANLFLFEALPQTLAREGSIIYHTRVYEDTILFLDRIKNDRMAIHRFNASIRVGWFYGYTTISSWTGVWNRRIGLLPLGSNSDYHNLYLLSQLPDLPFKDWLIPRSIYIDRPNLPWFNSRQVNPIVNYTTYNQAVDREKYR